jgi:hypothetical protein
MQISRHWRLNSQRYRLEGVRYADGKVDLQARARLQVNAPEQTASPVDVKTKQAIPAA